MEVSIRPSLVGTSSSLMRWQCNVRIHSFSFCVPTAADGTRQATPLGNMVRRLRIELPGIYLLVLGVPACVCVLLQRYLVHWTESGPHSFWLTPWHCSVHTTAKQRRDLFDEVVILVCCPVRNPHSSILQTPAFKPKYPFLCPHHHFDKFLPFLLNTFQSQPSRYRSSNLT